MPAIVAKTCLDLHGLVLQPFVLAYQAVVVQPTQTQTGVVRTDQQLGGLLHRRRALVVLLPAPPALPRARVHVQVRIGRVLLAVAHAGDLRTARVLASLVAAVHLCLVFELVEIHEIVEKHFALDQASRDSFSVGTEADRCDLCMNPAKKGEKGK